MSVLVIRSNDVDASPKTTRRRNSAASYTSSPRKSRRPSAKAVAALRNEPDSATSTFDASFNTDTTYCLSDDESVLSKQAAPHEKAEPLNASCKSLDFEEEEYLNLESSPTQVLLKDMRHTMDNLAAEERSIRKRCRVHSERAQVRADAGNSNGAILSLNKLYSTKIEQFRHFKALALVRKLELELNTMAQEEDHEKQEAKVPTFRWRAIKFGQARPDEIDAYVTPKPGKKKEKKEKEIPEKFSSFDEQVKKILRGDGESPEEWEDVLEEEDDMSHRRLSRGASRSKRGVTRSRSLMSALEKEYSSRSMQSVKEENCSSRSLITLQNALKTQNGDSTSSRSLGTIPKCNSNRAGFSSSRSLKAEKSNRSLPKRSTSSSSTSSSERPGLRSIKSPSAFGGSKKRISKSSKQ